MQGSSQVSQNFVFLGEHDPLFVELAAAAESAFASQRSSSTARSNQPNKGWSGRRISGQKVAEREKAQKGCAAEKRLSVTLR